VSSYVAKHIEFKLGLNPSKIQVIHNITDSVQTTPTVSRPRQKVLRELKLSDDVQIILTVGRVTDQKAHLELVEAFARIINQHSKTYLIIIGAKIDKPYLNRLEELISSKALVDRVLLLGARRDIPNWLAAADIFVFPSKYEGLPVALSEALVAGLPCISTNVGAIPELIRHEETGLLVPLNDVLAIASSISGLLNNEVLRKNLVLGAQVDILRRLNPTKKSQEMADLYRQTIMLFK
jgi:glycosyltransferase involved in cell wall biosynthesis